MTPKDRMTTCTGQTVAWQRLCESLCKHTAASGRERRPSRPPQSSSGDNMWRQTDGEASVCPAGERVLQGYLPPGAAALPVLRAGHGDGWPAAGRHAGKCSGYAAAADVAGEWTNTCKVVEASHSKWPMRLACTVCVCVCVCEIVWHCSYCWYVKGSSIFFCITLAQIFKSTLHSWHLADAFVQRKETRHFWWKNNRTGFKR